MCKPNEDNEVQNREEHPPGETSAGSIRPPIHHRPLTNHPGRKVHLLHFRVHPRHRTVLCHLGPGHPQQNPEPVLYQSAHPVCPVSQQKLHHAQGHQA